MKRLFEIDWPDNYGPDFFNAEMLQGILKERENFEYVNVTDVTPEKKTVPPRGGHDY